jgi:hypothetical protein
MSSRPNLGSRRLSSAHYRPYAVVKSWSNSGDEERRTAAEHGPSQSSMVTMQAWATLAAFTDEETEKDSRQSRAATQTKAWSCPGRRALSFPKERALFLRGNHCSRLASLPGRRWASRRARDPSGHGRKSDECNGGSLPRLIPGPVRARPRGKGSTRPYVARRPRSSAQIWARKPGRPDRAVRPPIPNRGVRAAG